MSAIPERALLSEGRRLSVYVSRRPGVPSGDPTRAYRRDWLDEDLPRLVARAGGQRPEPLSYDIRVGAYVNEVEFFRDQLLQRRTLRQGWGVPDLSLTLSDRDWVTNYLFACWKYWTRQGFPDLSARSATVAGMIAAVAPQADSAFGRHTILVRFAAMPRGAVVIVPKFGAAAAEDEHCFTVARVSGGYQFENRDHLTPNTWEKDFGHKREVTEVQVFRYGAATIPAPHFRRYRYAVNGPISDALLSRFLGGAGY
jgi:hypothetical protein